MEIGNKRKSDYLKIVKELAKKLDFRKFKYKKFGKLLFILGVLVISVVIGKNIIYDTLDYEINNTKIKTELINNTNIGKILGSSVVEASQATKSENIKIDKLDKRTYILNEYFKTRNSPLVGYANIFVDACDQFGAPRDCISLAAIARHETDLCNYGNSAVTYNCMGWGGAGEHRIVFDSFEEHIYTATDVLVNQYGLRYMDDPRLMETVFCGPQDECIGWGNRILFFMREIDNFSERIGMGRLTDLRDDGKRF